MHDRYQSPLGGRYASGAMQRIFSDDAKFTTWRRLWFALAEAERELGLDIAPEQIAEMRGHVADVDYDAAREQERKVRHDVMAHVHAYGLQCPRARPIIHLGATSCYVGDNTDVIQMRNGLDLLRRRIVNTVRALAKFAAEWAAQPALAFTHFQPAQPTTVGKRAALWIHDLTLDLERLDFERGRLRLLGCKGTTGTGASFLSLFGGDHGKVKRLERIIAEKMGFPGVCPVSGQTYSRKVDFAVLSVLSGIAQSAHKFSNDLRLLAHLKEIEEPFEAGQVGSSAMAYKRNPMRAERIAALARHVIANAQNPAFTAAGQWFERTLDDSANRRLAIPEAFLATDAILVLYQNVASGLVVYPKMIERRLRDELPFMATENVLMQAVKRGGDRQALHEAIRVHSLAAARKVKEEGGGNDLLDRLAADPAFGFTRAELDAMAAAEGFTGRAKEQTAEYLAEVVAPLLEANASVPETDAEVSV